MNLKPITSGCIFSVNKIQSQFNKLSSSSTVTFLLPFLHLLQLSFTIPPFLPFPTICPPLLSFLFKFHLSASIFFSPSVQNNNHSRKRGHQSSSMRPECERVPRLQQITISPYFHSTLDNTQEESPGRRGGRECRERVKETISDSRRTH